jgi:hypothetical protein
MASDRRQMPRPGRALGVPLLASAAALALLAFAVPASAEVVYENTPSSAAAEVASLEFEGTGTAELGSLLRLAGGARLDPTVRVAMTASGEPFSAPVTLSVYAPAPDREPGPLLARVTRSFEFSGEGPLEPIDFSLTGLTLPDEAIVAVAYRADADGDSLAVALAGPPGVGADPREAEGVYRAATTAGTAAPLAFMAEPLIWRGRQPAFTVEASAASPASPAAAPIPAAAPAPVRPYRRDYTVPPSRRMSVSFPRASARIAGPGALIEARCTGSSAARCVGTISLSAAGTVHKAAFSIGKGRRQYVVVPLGSDLGRLDGLARGTATASTIQVGGAAVRTKRELKLK